MCLLAIDLGGTKLALAVFSRNGDLSSEEKMRLDGRKGSEVGELICKAVEKFLIRGKADGKEIHSVGISVPGLYHPKGGRVWAPNIGGWDDYPLLHQVQAITGDIPVTIDSDRSCYILGEWWKGNAQNCTDAIFLAVGTGIGAGILTGGKILRGAQDIAGAIGWMALDRPFRQEYKGGCFESIASGEGLANLAKRLVSAKKDYKGLLKNELQTITAVDVFHAYDSGDEVAAHVLNQCIEVWGMAIANLVSLFNPQKIILGGGVFGPAIKFLPTIYEEAKKWAQPLSIKNVVIEASALGAGAGVYGAAYLALQNLKETNT